MTPVTRSSATWAGVSGVQEPVHMTGYGPWGAHTRPAVGVRGLFGCDHGGERPAETCSGCCRSTAHAESRMLGAPIRRGLSMAKSRSPLVASESPHLA
jgi:hypothetical protein